MSGLQSMRIAQQPAFVLHHRPYRNTSLLIEVLSRDHGRIGLVARGVRTSRSRLKGLLQPFVPLLLSWSGKGELLQLVAAEEGEETVSLPVDRLLCGLYVNELLLHLLHRFDPCSEVFDAYEWLLTTLSANESEESALRIFEKRLLSALGYGLMLATDTSGARVIPEKTYYYVLEHGPTVDAAPNAGIEIAGKSLLALHFETVTDPVVRREIKRLTRAVIDLHLGGRPLQTRALARAGLRSGSRRG